MSSCRWRKSSEMRYPDLNVTTIKQNGEGIKSLLEMFSDVLENPCERLVMDSCSI